MPPLWILLREQELRQKIRITLRLFLLGLFAVILLASVALHRFTPCPANKLFQCCISRDGANPGSVQTSSRGPKSRWPEEASEYFEVALEAAA